MASGEKQDFQQFRRYYQRLGPFFTKHKNSESTAAIFSLLAVSLFGWYAIRPTAQTILFLRREIADKTTVNQRMEEKITSLIEAQAAYEAAGEKISLADEAIPPAPQAVELATQLRNVAETTGASISAIQVQSVPLVKAATPSAATQTEEAGGFSLTIVLEGTYSSIYSFLDGIIGLRRINTIDFVTLRPSGSTSGSSIINLVLKLTSYYAVD